MTTTTDHSTTYRVVSPLIRDHADNPAIDFDRDEAVTRNELDALIRSVNELHGFALNTDLTVYDDDGSLWDGDDKIAEVAT